MLGADNLMGVSGCRADKVTLIDERFAIAVSGPNIADDAISVMNHFAQFSGHVRAGSVGDLLLKLVPTLAFYSACFVPIYEEQAARGDFANTPELMPALRSQCAVVVVLDCTTFELAEVNLGKPFGDLNPNPPIVLREPDRLHLFAQAEDRVEGNSMPLTEADMAVPVDALKREVAVDAARHPLSVGAAGGYVVAQRDHRPVFVSAFPSSNDWIRNRARATRHSVGLPPAAP